MRPPGAYLVVRDRPPPTLITTVADGSRSPDRGRCGPPTSPEWPPTRAHAPAVCESPTRMRRARYLAPNFITGTSIVFGLASLGLAQHAQWRLAAWMIIYAVLGDRLDGMVARKLR